MFTAARIGVFGADIIIGLCLTGLRVLRCFIKLLCRHGVRARLTHSVKIVSTTADVSSLLFFSSFLGAC